MRRITSEQRYKITLAYYYECNHSLKVSTIRNHLRATIKHGSYSFVKLITCSWYLDVWFSVIDTKPPDKTYSIMMKLRVLFYQVVCVYVLQIMPATNSFRQNKSYSSHGKVFLIWRKKGSWQWLLILLSCTFSCSMNKQFSSCPVPVNAHLRPDTHFGSIPEKLSAELDLFIKHYDNSILGPSGYWLFCVCAICLP